jgi:hypothetical protein
MPTCKNSLERCIPRACGQDMPACLSRFGSMYVT